MSNTTVGKSWVLVLASVLMCTMGFAAHAQIFPQEEYLAVVRTVDGSILTGRIVAGGDTIENGRPGDPVTIEIYGGSSFVVVPGNVVSISRTRNPDFGKEAPVLRLGDFTEPNGVGEPAEEGLGVTAEGDAGEVRQVRYPSFSGGIGFYAPLEMESGSDRMIDGGWSAGAVGIHVHSYDLVPLTVGLEIYRSAQGQNGNYDTFDGTVTSTGDDTFYPYFDGSETQLVPSLLIGNQWQAVAVGATWIGIERERPLFMPTVQWRNLRVAASLADEGYLSAQYHLPIDARADAARANIAALRESGVEREYRIDNRTWSRAFVRVNYGSLTAGPEIDYTIQTETGPEGRSIVLDGPNHNGASVGLELNRTLWRRLDVGAGAEFGILSNNGRLELEDAADDQIDTYEYRNVIGGYLRLAGYATDRLWMYGRFGMSITELTYDYLENQEVGFAELPNHSFFPHWWTDLGVGFGFLRDRRFGVDLEAGPRFSILQTGDVTDNQDPAAIGFGLQASVRRNDAPVSRRLRAADRGLDPAARAFGKPIWIRFSAGLRSNDQWNGLDDPIDISAAGTEYQGITDYSYWDSELHGAAEAAVQLLPAHAVGLRFQTNLTNTSSFIDVNTDGDEYRHLETDIAIPYGLFLFHHFTWRALGLKTQAGLRIAHVRYPDDPIFDELYGDARTFLHWGVAVGPTVRLFQFGDDNRNQIDLGLTYRHEWINLQQIFDETLSAPGFEIEFGYARRFGGRQ